MLTTQFQSVTFLSRSPSQREQQMARQKYRGNVLAANFPLLSSFVGHSVVIPQIDQFYLTPSSSAIEYKQDKNIGIPSVLFMENVMPIANGLSSIGFTSCISPHPSATDFDQAFWLRDSLEYRTLFVPAHGKNYIYNAADEEWTSPHPIFVSQEANVSVATIKQRTFVCYSKYLEFLEWVNGALVGLQFNGLTSEAVNGIVAANAYLIAYTDDTIYWSSILDPTDFMPSLATTAGSSKVLSVKGKILYCVSLSDGFLIYTTFNAIAATYTGNQAYPWTFKEIEGSPGIDETEEITKDNNATYQFANTQSGLVRLDKSNAVLVWPEITEFLNCRRLETYDYLLKKIKEKNLLEALIYKIALIANRFLVISYGYFALDFAIVFDIGLNRWGKLRVEHVDCFEYVGHPDVQVSLDDALRYIDLDPRTYEELTETYEELGGIFISGTIGEGQRPYKSLAFLKADGSVSIVDFDLTHQEEESVLYLGKYQLTRNRFIELYEIWMERLPAAESEFKLAVLVSFDGTTIADTVYPFLDTKNSNAVQRSYLPLLTAHNFILRLEGRFDLHNLELVFAEAGYR